MEKWKKILNHILYPPTWLIILFTIASAVALPIIFVKSWELTLGAYAMYAVSFYTVSVLCLFFARMLPKRYKEIKQKVNDNPIGNKYMTDAFFKVQVSLFISLAFNLMYSAFNLVSGIYYRSLWIGGVAVYYILLSVIRFLLLTHMGKKKDTGLIEEYRISRIIAILMMLINLTLSGIVLNMILSNRTAASSDVFVITSAVYTFYILAASIIDLVKYRKYESPVMSATKTIRFAQALVSLLSLEASMLTQFGDDESYRRLMLAITGAVVCIIVLSTSIIIIVSSTKRIKRLQPEER